MLLERFVQLHYVSASADERRAFERLISLPDPDLADYLFGYAAPAAGLEGIVARVAATAVPAQPGGTLDASDYC